LKYKIGDRVRIVQWFGSEGQLIGKIAIIKYINVGFTYPYEMVTSSGATVVAKDDEIVLDKEYNIKKLLDEIDEM